MSDILDQAIETIKRRQDQERIKELETRLTTINNIIFGETIVLGSEEYFAIRELAAKTQREVNEKEKQSNEQRQV